MRNEIKARQEKEIREELIHEGFIAVSLNEFDKNEDSAICDRHGNKLQPESENDVYITIGDTHRWDFWTDETWIYVSSFNNTPVSEEILNKIGSILRRLGFRIIFDEDIISFLVRTGYYKILEETTLNQMRTNAFSIDHRTINTNTLFKKLNSNNHQIHTHNFRNCCKVVTLEFQLKHTDEYFCYRNPDEKIFPKRIFDSIKGYESYEVVSDVIAIIKQCGFRAEYNPRSKSYIVYLIDFLPIFYN